MGATLICRKNINLIATLINCHSVGIENQRKLIFSILLIQTTHYQRNGKDSSTMTKSILSPVAGVAMVRQAHQP
jgi:hypothetical protein